MINQHRTFLTQQTAWLIFNGYACNEFQRLQLLNSLQNGFHLYNFPSKSTHVSYLISQSGKLEIDVKCVHFHTTLINILHKEYMEPEVVDW